MINPDHINGFFELFGAVAMGKNVLTVLKDKKVHGVHWMPGVFFTSWGYWNCFYYPHLAQMWSFIGGATMSVMNTAYFVLVAHYSYKQTKAA